jgi:hypothetical protein
MGVFSKSKDAESEQSAVGGEAIAVAGDGDRPEEAMPDEDGAEPVLDAGNEEADILSQYGDAAEAEPDGDSDVGDGVGDGTQPTPEDGTTNDLMDIFTSEEEVDVDMSALTQSLEPVAAASLVETAMEIRSRLQALVSE